MKQLHVGGTGCDDRLSGHGIQTSDLSLSSVIQHGTRLGDEECVERATLLEIASCLARLVHEFVLYICIDMLLLVFLYKHNTGII